MDIQSSDKSIFVNITTVHLLEFFDGYSDERFNNLYINILLQNIVLQYLTYSCWKGHNVRYYEIY